jgi:hypothetical protein
MQLPRVATAFQSLMPRATTTYAQPPQHSVGHGAAVDQTQTGELDGGQEVGHRWRLGIGDAGPLVSNQTSGKKFGHGWVSPTVVCRGWQPTPVLPILTVKISDLALDALSGHEQQNVLRSWKGDATAFTEAGFELSGRYRFTEDELRRQGPSYPSARCPVCGDQADRGA